MLGKIIKSAGSAIGKAVISSGKQVLGLGNESETLNPMPYPHQPIQQPQYSMPEMAEYQIPPHIDPNINPNADWEYYRQLVSSQEFVRSQYQQQQYQYQQQQMYSQVLDNMRAARTEYQSQQLASGASPDYYARLNQAYQRGIASMQSNPQKK